MPLYRVSPGGSTMARMAESKPTEAQLARRVSMLTAEHASLQAQRNSTQAEVLVRQGLYLTLASAVLVSLGLVAQAIGFSRDFFVVAICALAVVVLLGFFTLVRQGNADAEDIMYVLAMNRIRGAYAALDPAVAHEFLASRHDDMRGAFLTYYFFGERRNTVVASAAVFLTIVNAGVLGLLGGAVTALAGGGLVLAVVVGAVAAAAGFVAVIYATWRGFRYTMDAVDTRYPSPPRGS